MRRVMVLAAMLAMVLVMAAPAYAQIFVVQDVDQFGVVDESVSSQVFNVAVQQFNAGNQIAVAFADADATATAGEFGSATAGAFAGANAVNIANAAGISINTVNVSLNN